MNLQMSRRFYAGLVLALVSTSSLVGRAEPTPSGVPLRPLSTDRPDVTESPNTVDAGHFQLEAELARVSDDEALRSYGFGHTNLKVGLAHFWDFQLVVESLVGVEVDDGYDWGFGDVTFRTKLNLFGNDGGPALALMPWTKVPTAGSRGNDKVEGGLMLPFGVELPWEFEAGLMVEGDWMANEADDDYHLELLTSATVGHTLVGPLSAFAEVFGVYSTEPDASYALAVDFGFTVDIDGWLQPDAGIALGLTEAAEDYAVFAGLSLKL